MMTQKHIGYRSWNDDFPRDTMPHVQQAGNTAAGGYVFTMQDGTVTMEAEHFFAATPTLATEWTVIPDMGRTRSAVALMPYTQPVNDAHLVYKWNGPELTDAEVHVVTKSTLDFLNKGGLTFTVQLDDGEPVAVNFNESLNEKPENIYSVYYPTVARRVVESTVTVPGSFAAGTHTLTLRPQDPAIVFEKIVVTTTSLPHTYLFGNESYYKHD